MMIVETVHIQQLQDLLWSFPHSAEIRKICCTFAKLFNEQLSNGTVAKVWDGICPRFFTDLTTLTMKVWPAFLLQLYKVAVDLSTLNISCEYAASLLDSGKADFELNCLQSTLYECCILEHSVFFQPVEVKQRLLLFKDIESVEKEAKSLLELKDTLGLTGNFDPVVNISQVSNSSLTTLVIRSTRFVSTLYSVPLIYASSHSDVLMVL